jgi:hypothetical protein
VGFRTLVPSTFQCLPCCFLCFPYAQSLPHLVFPVSGTPLFKLGSPRRFRLFGFPLGLCRSLLFLDGSAQEGFRIHQSGFPVAAVSTSMAMQHCVVGVAPKLTTRVVLIEIGARCLALWTRDRHCSFHSNWVGGAMTQPPVVNAPNRLRRRTCLRRLPNPYTSA